MKNAINKIDVAYVDNAIQMLNKYAKEPSIKPLISILEALKEDADNESLLAQLTETWHSFNLCAIFLYVNTR